MASVGMRVSAGASAVPDPAAGRTGQPRVRHALGCGAGCLLLAVVSWLLWPSSIGYDPLSWAVWGREVAHGGLTIGPWDAVFKPEPVAVDAVLSALHLPVLPGWAVIVRAGTAGALLAAFLLGRRTAGTTAALFAVLALVGVPRFLVWYTAATTVETLEAAALLAAVACAARRRTGAALLWLALLSGLRPEGWPLLLLCAGWVVGRRWRTALWVAPLVVATIGSWFLGEYVGSGRWSTGVARAGQPSLGGALLTPVPGWTVVREAWASLPAAWWLVAVVTLAGAAGIAVHRRRVAGAPALALLLGGVGLLWLAVVAVSTQLRLSAGEPRYLVGTTVCGAVLAAVGAAAVVCEMSMLRRGAPVAVLLALALAGYGGARAYGQGHTAVPELARRYGEQADLARVLAGAPGVRECPRIATAPEQVPAVAWDLGAPLGAVGLEPEPHAVWVVPATRPLPSAGAEVRYADAHWWVAVACR